MVRNRHERWLYTSPNKMIIFWLFAECSVLFALGASVGSFLGAYITRLARSESVVRGRSKCDHCSHSLSWRDNIPLLSWLLLKRRCRYCHKPLSPFFPAIELVTGTIFLVLGFLFVDNITLVRYPVNFLIMGLGLGLVIACSLIVVFFTDWKYGLIPDSAIIAGIIATVVVKTFSGTTLPFDVLAASAACLFFWFLVKITRGRGMGGGDVTLAFLLGLIVGWPQVLVALFTAFVSGAFVSVVLILLKVKTLKDTIHFGPFLVASIPVTLLFGDALIKWYLYLTAIY